MAFPHRLVCAVAFVVLVSPQLGAQAVGSIRGRVVDSTSQQPLTNVAVVVDGTSRGTESRVDGTFDLGGVPVGSHTVRARRIGYHTMVVPVTVTAGEVATVNFSLAPQAAVLSEVVATGYGTQRREAITASITNIDAAQAKVGVVTNVSQLMQGRAAGVQIVQSNGEPGGNTQIRIRGGTSISASNDPLYVIDGVPIQNQSQTPDAAGVLFNASLPRNPLNSINPDDIESVTILKDAAATAIYGSRAANGVILITTKRGGRESAVEYEVYVGSSSQAKKLGLASGGQYRAFVTQFKDSLGGQTAIDALGTANTDWEGAISENAMSMNHNLAFTGGSNSTKYRASLNYFDREGVITNSGLKRYQGRLNATHDALDGRLRLGLNLMASRVNNQFSPNENGGGFLGGLFTNMVIYNPTYPIDCSANLKPCAAQSSNYFETGTGAQDLRNPVAMLHQITDFGPENRLLGNLTGTIGLTDWLTSQTTVGSDITASDRRTYLPRTSPLGANFNGYARQVNKNLNNYTFNQLLTFSPRLTGQELEVVGGYEYTKDDNMEFGTASQNFISDAFGVDNLVAGGSIPVGYPYSWHVEDKLASFFGRATYGYADRYFLTGVLRRDGSSRLAKGHEWATFPALSASWRLSEEGFFRSHPLGVSNLALRAGWGKQGNQSINPYQTLLLLRSDPGALYPFGGVVTSGLAAAQVGNPNLKWETATQTNVGLDWGLRNDQITGGFEIYQKNTKDLLLARAVPQPAVVSTRIENVGSVRNRGFEAFADMSLWNAGRKSLTGGLVLSVERNQVTSLGDTTAACSGSLSTFAAYTAAKCTYITTGSVQGQGQSNQWSQVIMKGQAIGTFLAPKFVGVNKGVQYFACTKAVDPTCADIAGFASNVTSNPQDADRQFIGTANPSFTLGVHNNLKWNAFDASWLWRGEFGGKTFDNTALVYQTKSDAKQGRNFLAKAIDMPDNISEPAKYSSRWIYDRTFVRLQNLTVGYQLPATLTRARETRIYVSGDNLMLFTKYPGYDPEVFTSLGLASRGIDYLTYPPTRNFTIGARTQF